MDRYLRLTTRRQLIDIYIWFIQQCVKEKITPTFASIRTSRNVPLNIKLDMEHILLNKEICVHYAKLDTINTELKFIINNISQHLPFQERLNNHLDDFI